MVPPTCGPPNRWAIDKNQLAGVLPHLCRPRRPETPKPRIMATARLQLDEFAIRPAIAEVRDDGLDTDFLILHYESKNSIVLKT